MTWMKKDNEEGGRGKQSKKKRKRKMDEGKMKRKM